MKVIFLDVDGVLNRITTTVKTKNNYLFVDDDLVARVADIARATSAKVVISSDWRSDLDNIKNYEDYLELLNKLKEFGLEIYGTTPEIDVARRGDEIARYVYMHPEITKYVILDDRPTLGQFDGAPQFIQTDYCIGLTEEQKEKAIEILNS